jgi:hypothetical protein
MVNRKAALLVISALATSACIPAADPGMVSSSSDITDAAACNSKTVERFVGKRFTAVLAEQMRKEAGASVVRTGPKDGAVTMDYIAARLNVFYDDEMLIAVVSCG